MAMQHLSATGKVTDYTVLFGSAVTLPAHEVVGLYQSRFEMELVF